MSLAVALYLWLACAPARAESPRHPNLVLIVADDVGYGDLACHGNKVVRTPHLDRLHGDSVRLTDFHVDPTCSPTRAALMTGRYSSRTGVWHTIMGRSLLRRDEVTLADHFAKADYHTGIFGKWHLGDNYPYRARDRGWQKSLVIGGGGIGHAPDAWGNTYFDDVYRRDGKPQKQKGYCTDVFVSAAIDFIDRSLKHRKAAPFFCYVPTNAAHAPYHVAQKYSKPYRDKGVPQARANFYGMITNLDENVGRLLAKLKEWKIEDNTLVIFMTDNGTAEGWNQAKEEGFNAGMRGVKGSAYEGGHRVPCFVRWTGKLKGGRDVPQLTAHVDLLPTLLDLCGVEAKHKLPIDGVSLKPLLEGKKGKWPARTLFVHSQRIDHPEKGRQFAVMTQRWRLVGKELYDLPADPGQKKDVAAKHPEVVKELRAGYDAWWKSISTRFDEYCEIVLGSDAEDPTTLTSHDWHGEVVPWNQQMVKSMPKANGFWAVEVAKAGKYRVTLRHQPAEAKFALRATKARVKVGDVEKSAEVKGGACEVTLELSLKPGKTRLQTWLSGKDEERGAFYVEVRRVE
jgi:arylsulfatase A-like enzyme